MSWALAVLLAAAPPAITLKDVEGRSHTPLSQPGKKAVALIFLMPDCPIANYYAPEISRICQEYGEKGVACFLVHVDPDVTAAQAARHARSHGLKGTVLLDPRHELARKAGVTIAPEACVFTPSGSLAYRGRIDDIYVDYGKRRAAPSKRDLRDALDAVLAGKKVAAPVTKAIGCLLPEPLK
jgi:peroxiredoxin